MDLDSIGATASGTIPRDATASGAAPSGARHCVHANIPVAMTLVVITGTLVPDRLTNTGQTLQQVCSQGLAPIVGGLVGGFVYEHVGAQQLFLGSAAGIVAGIAIVWTSTTTLAGPATE